MRDLLFIFFELIYIFTRCNCELEPFVVGGDFANIERFPHAVYLSVQCPFYWICGASILNQRILITAAHCLEGCNLSKKEHAMKAYAGHENLDKVKAVRTVSYVTIHSRYDVDTVANDIALAVVKQKFPLGKSIKRVIITKSSQTMSGIVAGWGITDENTEKDTILLKSVKQTIRSHNTCRHIGALERGMFCAGSTSALADHPARGDSGSALITSRFQEIGLVSFRISKYPALLVYTNVSFYYDWIQRHAKRLYCKAKGK